MGVASGCGCKEVYRFHHTTYPYSFVSFHFCSSISTFCSFLKCFSFIIIIYIYLSTHLNPVYSIHTYMYIRRGQVKEREGEREKDK